MAQRGYLGKISAIVTVNASSVKPSLDSSAKDINAWAKSTQSRISGAANSAGRALEGIFTPLQRLQAAIKNANRNPLDLKIQNADSYLQLARATEQIAKPLGQLQQQFSGLAGGVQAELLPVLQSAQKQATSLFGAISGGAKVSDRDIENTAARVERLNQALRRASEASAITGSLSTGQELRFQQPDFLAQTRRASELQQQAAGLSPAQFASRDFASLVSQQRQAAIEAERLLAALDRVRTTRNGDAVAAERQYSQQIAALGAINSKLAEQIALAKATVVENQGEATNVRERLAAISEVLRVQQEEAAFRSKAADEAEREAQATAKVVEQLNKAFSIEQERRSGASARRNASVFDIATGGLAKPAATPQAESIFASPARTVQSEIQRTRDLYQKFLQLSPEFQKQLAAQGAGLNNLANAATRGSATLGVLAAANDRMAESLSQAAAAANNFVPFDDLALQARNIREASDALKKLASDAREASAASNFGGRFAEAFETSQIDSARAKVKTLRDILIASGISGGTAARAIDAYSDALQRAASSGGGLRSAAAAIKAAEQAASQAVASATGRSAASVTERLKRAGDIGRLGLDRFSLAANQAAFAIDDFFSSTGGLEFKLRAVSNNITQLAFILGGTTGLFVGLAAVIGGQVAIAFGKYLGVLGDTKKQEAEAKAQTEALNSAYQRQQDIVQSLADSYRELAKNIREATESPQNRAFNERRSTIADLRQRQQDAARERVAQAVPQIFNNRRQRGLLEAQLQEQPDFAAQQRIRRQIGRLQADENAAFNAINENAGRLANQPRADLVRQRDELAVLRDNLVRDAGRLPAGGQAQRNVNARLDDVSTRLAAFNIAIQRVTDDAVAAAVEFAGPLKDNIQKAQQRLAEAFGDTPAAAQSQLEGLGRRLEEAINASAAGQEDRRAVRARIDAIRQEAAPLLDAQQELVDFADALRTAAEAARRSETQAKERLQEAAANAQDLPGSGLAQAQQQAAAQTAEEATRRRREIEAATQGGRNAAAVGDLGEIERRRQQVAGLSGGLGRFQRDADRQQERLRRGFELTAGELGNFQEKLQSDILAIEERAKQEPLNAQKLLQEGRAALARENAPLFAELAANVQNALLQGPSRAALNAADATTVEGSRELNRLLRGDDPARDVNLLELQKQTANLASIDKGIKDLANKIGVAP